MILNKSKFIIFVSLSVLAIGSLIYYPGLWFIFWGYFFVILSVYIRKEFTRPLTPNPIIQVRDHSQYSPGPLHRKVLDGEQMYSEILMKVVRLCCYQTARLEDKYCVCGRALVYPIDMEHYI